MKTVIFSIIPIALMMTCKMITQPTEETIFLSKWKSKNIQNYTIDQSRSCFCPQSDETVHLTVKSGNIVHAVRLSDSSTSTYPYYYTIDSLFGIIKGNNYDSIVARYNDEYGFPEYMDIDPQQHPVDGGYLIKTSNFKRIK
jgi:hypothetical protein